MKTNKNYDSPVIKEIETKLEGIVCASDDCPAYSEHNLDGDQNACNNGGFPGFPGSRN